MGATDIILQLAEKNNGIVTTSMVTAAGISRGNLNYLVDMGKLEKTSRGVYILPEAWEDEFINLQSRFKRGVFSHETALFLSLIHIYRPSLPRGPWRSGKHPPDWS